METQNPLHFQTNLDFNLLRIKLRNEKFIPLSETNKETNKEIKKEIKSKDETQIVKLWIVSGKQWNSKIINRNWLFMDENKDGEWKDKPLIRNNFRERYYFKEI